MVTNGVSQIHSPPREAVKFLGIFLCGWNVAHFVVGWLLWPVFKEVALGRCRSSGICIPCYLVNIYQCFGGAYHLHLEVAAVMATVCSSKMLVTRCNMWEGLDLHQFCCENHISCIVSPFCMSTGILYSSAALSLSKQSFGSFSNAGSAMSNLHYFCSEGLIHPQDFARTGSLMIVYSIVYVCLLQGLQTKDSLQLLQLLNMPGRVTRNMLGGMTIWNPLLAPFMTGLILG